MKRVASAASIGSRWRELWLGIPGFQIAGGTAEIPRNLIADQTLGLPAEAGADEGLASREVPTGPR